eukprot:10149963-Alexandrium_andersonii.AAC.1
MLSGSGVMLPGSGIGLVARAKLAHLSCRGANGRFSTLTRSWHQEKAFDTSMPKARRRRQS